MLSLGTIYMNINTITKLLRKQDEILLKKKYYSKKSDYRLFCICSVRDDAYIIKNQSEPLYDQNTT